MTTLQLPRHLQAMRVKSYASMAPPPLVEYTYYAILFYNMTAAALGILIPKLAGGMLLMLAAFCIMRLGSQATAVYAPIKLPLACVTSYLVVQITFHGASVTEGIDFITWLLMLIIVQSLCLRWGFLHRCALMLFIMGLTTLPFLTFLGPVGAMHERAAVSRDSMITGDFNNANGLGAWFGFCCLYFIIVGIETKRNWVRVISGLAALGCLYIVGLTVSRGILLALAIGITIAFRRLLRRGFVPLLVFLILSGTLFTFGVFDQIISHYTARSTEETGRLLVWPAAIERFLSSPLLGVGAANIRTYVPGGYKSGFTRGISPHNGFLYFALSSGVFPLALFVAWWIRAAQNAFSYDERLDYGPFRLPLFAYTFVHMLFGDLAFFAPWCIVVLSVAMAPHPPYGVRRLVVIARHRMANALEPRGS